MEGTEGGIGRRQTVGSVGPPGGAAPRSAGRRPPAAAACAGTQGARERPRGAPGLGLAPPRHSILVWGAQAQPLPCSPSPISAGPLCLHGVCSKGLGQEAPTTATPSCTSMAGPCSPNLSMEPDSLAPPHPGSAPSPPGPSIPLQLPPPCCGTAQAHLTAPHAPPPSRQHTARPTPTSARGLPRPHRAPRRPARAPPSRQCPGRSP